MPAGLPTNVRIKRFGLNWNVDWLAGQSLLPFSESTSADQCCSQCKHVSIARRRRLQEAVRRGTGATTAETGVEAETSIEGNHEPEEPNPAPADRKQREAARRAAQARERAVEAAAQLAQLPKDPVEAAGK